MACGYHVWIKEAQRCSIMLIAQSLPSDLVEHPSVTGRKSVLLVDVVRLSDVFITGDSCHVEHAHIYGHFLVS